jgi:hypothetical protein
MSPTATLRARGIEPMHTYHFRDRARLGIRDARSAVWDVEFNFDDAARYLSEGDEAQAWHYLERALAKIESLRWLRKQIKADALMAVRGTPIEYWTAARRREHRLEREAWLAKFV